MLLMPFLALALGITIGLKKNTPMVIKVSDVITSIALLMLMLVIGTNIGSNDELMKSLPQIGLNCLLVCLTAIFFSILLVFILEKTVISLSKMSITSKEDEANDEDEKNEENEENVPNHFIWVMPLSIITGILFGHYLMPRDYIFVLDKLLFLSLMILYIGVGISAGVNKAIFQYVKQLGLKILLVPICVFIGSIIGGVFIGLVMDIPLYISTISASGVGYYSVTGAYMSQIYGAEAGTYGFMVNVFREFITILFVPLMVKISKGAPIASGGAGNMDVTLIPVTNVIGRDLLLVTMFSGTVLTFLVPAFLPILTHIFA